MRPSSRTRPRRRRSHARLRPGLRLRRDPRLWWAAVLTVALTGGWLVSSVVAGAERAQGEWGSRARVLVVTRYLEAGDTLQPRDVRMVAWPAALVPAGALRDVPDEAVLRSAVFEGEVLVAGRIAPDGLVGVAAKLPGGTRGIAIPVEPGTAPPLTVGDHVDVLVALPPDAAGDGPPGFTVAADVVVVAVDEASVTVAVSRAVAPRIAVALGAGAVTLALVGA